MRIYEIVRENGAIEPWNQEIERGFYIDLDWRQWLIGIAVYGYSVSGYVVTVNLGPLSASFYINR